MKDSTLSKIIKVFDVFYDDFGFLELGDLFLLFLKKLKKGLGPPWPKSPKKSSINRPKTAALSSVWIGANYVKSDMVPIRNTTRKKKSEFGRGGINSDFSTTFDHFRHDFNDFRKKWNFEKSEKKWFSIFFYIIFIKIKNNYLIIIVVKKGLKK